MVTETSIIETGVDKLVNLVKSKGRIASEDATKYLGVSATVIMEWAEFLEEEGIISVEYKFTKPFLVARKLAKKDVKEKVKEFSGKKDIFIRKAEGSLGFLQRGADKLNSIKKEFGNIRKDLGFDISSVKTELEDLEKYEILKIDLDRHIENQKKTSMDKIEMMSRQISKQRKDYDSILTGIKKEESELEREKNNVKSLEESERLIMQRLSSIKDTLKKVENKAWNENEDIKLSEKNIRKLTIMARNIRNSIEKEKELIGPLVKKSEEQAKKIKELQDIVIKKVEEKEKKLKGAKKVSDRIKNLFNKKVEIIGLIENLNKDRNNLQKELVELINKAKSFQLSSNSVDMETQMTDIEEKFEGVHAKKKIFEKEIKKLSSFFK